MGFSARSTRSQNGNAGMSVRVPRAPAETLQAHAAAGAVASGAAERAVAVSDDLHAEVPAVTARELSRAAGCSAEPAGRGSMHVMWCVDPRGLCVSRTFGIDRAWSRKVLSQIGTGLTPGTVLRVPSTPSAHIPDTKCRGNASAMVWKSASFSRSEADSSIAHAAIRQSDGLRIVRPFFLKVR